MARSYANILDPILMVNGTDPDHLLYNERSKSTLWLDLNIGDANTLDPILMVNGTDPDRLLYNELSKSTLWLELKIGDANTLEMRTHLKCELEMRTHWTHKFESNRR